MNNLIVEKDSTEDFIYVNDTAAPVEFCTELVNYVKEHEEKFTELSVKWDSKLERVPKSTRDDLSFMVEYFNTFPDTMYEFITNTITAEAGEYLKRYKVIFEGKEFSSPKIKYHVVSKFGGYHNWHQEWTPNIEQNSVLVWHLSLTDHKEEGELDFLYYNKRIEPKAGRLIMWPAYFTHTHRGNPIKTNNEKHYLTGWWFAASGNTTGK
jgi:hypothetical protein